MNNSAINGHARTASPTAGSGSATQTQPATRQPRMHATLRLRGAAPSSRDRHIQWDESVVDNEGMGKKSSKVCCIYHKPRAAGESSSEDSSSSSSESDSDNSDSGPDTSRAMPAGGARGKSRKSRSSRGRHHRHHHHHHHGDDDDGCGGDASGKGKQRDYSPNAYERMPKYKTSSAVRKP